MLLRIKKLRKERNVRSIHRAALKIKRDRKVADRSPFRGFPTPGTTNSLGNKFEESPIIEVMRPLRNKDPELYRLITIRTGEARLWITPNAKVKRLLGGILARYQEIFGVTIYAYNFLGNHYHLLIKAPQGNSDEFCENVNREIARRLNFVHHREGKLWGRRYDDQEVLTEEDLLEAFLYVTTNATRHGIARDLREWPGFNSYNQSVTGEAKSFAFFHYSKEEDEGRVTTHVLKVSPLPQHAKLTQEKRKALLSKLVSARIAALVSERKDKGLGFLGLDGIRSQIPGETPRSVSRSPRPPCYTFNSELRREFRKQCAYRRELYDYASMRYRLGVENIEFPPHTFRPPLHRAPRILPFKLLTRADLELAA